MAPTKRSGKSVLGSSRSKKELPAPFKPASDRLKPFCEEALSRKHVYITHVDFKPRAFKRKIFLVPVAMNITVALLFCWRLYSVAPYYFDIIATALGYHHENAVRPADMSWSELSSIILTRTLTFMLDFVLIVFVWPWPVEFCYGPVHGSPMQWRFGLGGFRDKEVYVRRSRAWDQNMGDVLTDDEARNILLSRVRLATSPTLIQEKTGYLTMNGEWDLDWAAMVHATKLVDNQKLPLDAFRTLVLLHSEAHGWLCIDLNLGENAKEDERRRQVFAFRDALAAIGKEDLFFRWIELVQYETTQPGGFGPERQAEAAQKVRDLFRESDLDFDELWRESVGSETLAVLV